MSNSTSRATLFKLNPTHFLSKPTESGKVQCIDTESEEMDLYEFEGVAALIIRKLTKECSQEEIVTEVMEEFEGSQDEVTADVKEFLEDLKEKGIISSTRA
ncbi:MAG: PqqD family protein [Bacteriovoracaceae bacterium]|nr:PqqD family protein [Bacteriovoracaceae bacterium]